MAKTWSYAFMVFAIIGMVVAAGSAAAATKETAAAPAAGPVGISPSSIIDTSSYPNLVWFVTTAASDANPTTVYTVPASYKLKIDDVVVTNGDPNLALNYIYRGTSGAMPVMFIPITGWGSFEHSYQNLVLNNGEILKVKTYGSTGVGWTITGHLI